MYKHINKISDFVSWLSKQYKEIQEFRNKNYPFRLLEERRLPKTGDTIFTVQFVGKSTCIKLTACELANDDDLIHGFSPSDVKHIIKASLTKTKLSVIQGGQQRPPYRIVAKNFTRGKEKLSYIIEQTSQTNKTSTHTVNLDELARSKEMLPKFSKKDIFEIAYSAGAQSILNEEAQMQSAKENN